jgi:hypothetical protein
MSIIAGKHSEQLYSEQLEVRQGYQGNHETNPRAQIPEVQAALVHINVTFLWITPESLRILKICHCDMAVLEINPP